MLTGSYPIFVAKDVAATVKFYTEVLGFTSSWTVDDPPTFGAATREKVTLMFNRQPELEGKMEGHQQWIDVDDVDELYAQHLERGAPIVSALEDKPWSKREYTVRDINGYHLRFAGNPAYASKGSGVLPAEVKIGCRLLTLEEYGRIAGSAFYSRGAPDEILDRTWKSVVATDAKGEAIGITRIMYDAPGWFSIWDVAVVPQWQGQRIGTAMMEAAMQLVREESPGAFMYLFTIKHAFYEKLGFSNESVQMCKL